MASLFPISGSTVSLFPTSTSAPSLVLVSGRYGFNPQARTKAFRSRLLLAFAVVIVIVEKMGRRVQRKASRTKVLGSRRFWRGLLRPCLCQRCRSCFCIISGRGSRGGGRHEPSTGWRGAHSVSSKAMSSRSSFSLVSMSELSVGGVVEVEIGIWDRENYARSVEGWRVLW